MASTWNLSKGLAAVVTASAAAFGLSPSAAADPAAPQPNSTQEMPGLPALSQLSPIIQQAAGNPAQATQLLMAAAQAFTHNPTAPNESKNVAESVNQFLQEPVPGAPAPNGVTPPDAAPAPHVPPLGIEPGGQAHLPTGIDPAHAAGPRPEAPPMATAAPVPGAYRPSPAPAAAPAPAPAAPEAVAPAPQAAPVAAPPPDAAAAPAPAPARRPAPPRRLPASGPTPRPRRTSCIPRSAPIA